MAICKTPVRGAARERLRTVPLLSGRLEELRAGHGGEGAGEHLGSVRRRRSLRASAVEARAIRAVRQTPLREEEVVAVPRQVDPLLPLSVVVRERGEHIDLAPLHPHVLEGVVHRAVPAEAVQVSAALAVYGMPLPERHDAVVELPLVAHAHFLRPADGRGVIPAMHDESIGQIKGLAFP